MVCFYPNKHIKTSRNILQNFFCVQSLSIGSKCVRVICICFCHMISLSLPSLQNIFIFVFILNRPSPGVNLTLSKRDRNLWTSSFILNSNSKFKFEKSFLPYKYFFPKTFNKIYIQYKSSIRTQYDIILNIIYMAMGAGNIYWLVSSIADIQFIFHNILAFSNIHCRHHVVIQYRDKVLIKIVSSTKWDFRYW